jgi:hypothetical protein
MPPDKLEIRTAVRADVPAIVRMLADDHLGSQRERPVEPIAKQYYQAFDDITTDPNQLLLVSILGGRIVHNSRTEAQRFYERLGFAPSHIGMKLAL